MAWNGSESKGAASVPQKAARKSPPSKVRGLVALIVIVVGGGVAAWFALRPAQEGEEVGGVGKRGQIAEVKPQIPTNNVGVAEEVTPKDAPEPPPAKPKTFATVYRARSSKQGQVMTLMDGTVVTNTPRNIFKRDFERTLYASMRPGGMVGNALAVLAQKYSDAELMRMLQEMTVPEEGDDEVAAAAKNRVQQLKEEMLLEVKSGRSARDVLMDIRRERVGDNLLRAQAFKVRTEALRSGDRELAKETVAEANKMLEGSGLRPMHVPGGENPNSESAESQTIEQENANEDKQ